MIHELVEGARILGAQLSTCESCGVLHVEEEGRPDAWIRRTAYEVSRVSEAPPPCLPPMPPFVPAGTW